MDRIQDRLFNEITGGELFEKAVGLGNGYIADAFDRNVFPSEKDIESLSVFDEALPDSFTPAGEIIEKLDRYGSPATVAQIGGRYFGFVDGSIVPAGLAARILTDFWDQNSAMQVISPIASKLEQVTERWLRGILSLPNHTVAGFVSGTSMATFCGLAAARYRVLMRQGWNINEKGMYGAPEIRVVTGRQAHSSALKMISLLGFGKDNIEWVDTDDQGRIIPDKIPALDESCILLLQAGNVNSGSFDDFTTICPDAKKRGAWIHIDGAFGLWAAASERLKYLTAGMEHADSWSVDAHKTLNTPYDNGIILCADEDALTSALHMTGSYIVIGKERDGMYYTPEMSRRARIFELWATIRSLGKRGIDEMVTGMHERALQFADELRDAGFEIPNEIVYNQVLVRFKDDDTTKEILKLVQNERVCWCGGSKWHGNDVIRISVCSWATTADDVRRSVDSFVKAKNAVCG